jgi:rubrerythrin
MKTIEEKINKIKTKELKLKELLKAATYALNMIPRTKNVGEDGEDSYQLVSSIEKEMGKIYDSEDNISNSTGIWVCDVCNSADVEHKVWANLNTKEIFDLVISGEGGEGDCYCPNCEDHTNLTYIPNLPTLPF